MKVAMQVESPLYDKEMVAMFIGTLQSPFYEHMIVNVSLNFADIVVIGERVEVCVKNGRIAYGPVGYSHAKKLEFNA